MPICANAGTVEAIAATNIAATANNAGTLGNKEVFLWPSISACKVIKSGACGATSETMYLNAAFESEELVVPAIARRS